ncbi:hypothetical protein GCM10009539_54650 [Cryptosporangium japonicum]|uniref:Uncharacterized protein n=1 Tax=Cryptosporangium japonicum TaxID=80872 RepID=A0ABP3EFL9_9ACTN
MPVPVRADGASSAPPAELPSGAADDAGCTRARAAGAAGFRPPGAPGDEGSAAAAPPDSSAADVEDLSVIANSAASADPGATLKISEACFGPEDSTSSAGADSVRAASL